MIKLPEPSGFDVHMRRSTYTADQLKQAIRDALDAADDLMFDIKGCKVTLFDAQTAIRKLKEGIQ